MPADLTDPDLDIVAKLLRDTIAAEPSVRSHTS
jgi:hypothetical protein